MERGVVEKAVCWIRRDLRLTDHRALAESTHRARQTAVVFVYDTNILGQLSDKADKRVTFIHKSLEELHSSLAKRGSGLFAVVGDPCDMVPKVVEALGATAVFANHDDDPYALKRDSAVRRRLRESGVAFETFKDHVVLERQEVLTKSEGVYRSFSPYADAWEQALEPEDLTDHAPDLKRLWPAKGCALEPGNVALKKLGFREAKLPIEPGERAASLTLKAFLKRIGSYERDRDFPAREATSGMGPHLRFGTVSVREMFAAARDAGATKWKSEMVWREFAHMVLANFPHIATRCWDERYEEIAWPGLDAHFDAWKQGETGVPIVDAAMRCLNETGQMHNRLRMVAASYLIKDLMLDWKRGEAYFAEKLLDYDLASNVYNWQWCAGCSPSAQPYFRVFNPDRQAERFDPDGEFVRKWGPKKPRKPIVDHAVQSRKVVSLYKSALDGA